MIFLSFFLNQNILVKGKVVQSQTENSVLYFLNLKKMKLCSINRKLHTATKNQYLRKINIFNDLIVLFDI